MKTIIGLGQAGCNIAEKFKKYPQYEIFKIDVGLKNETNSYAMERQENPELYESKCPNFKAFFKEVSNDILFITSSGNISGASLRVLEQLKNKNTNINILYIKPDLSLLSETKSLQENLIFHVLQEYARSAVFEKIFLVSNTELENILGSIPVTGYYDKLNELIVSTIHMYNIFRNTDPISSTFAPTLPSARIATFGLFDVNGEEEKMFFSFDITREKRYYYGINKETLKTDGELFKKIKNRTKKQDNKTVKASHAIYPTNYEQNYGYVLDYTSKIQLDTLRYDGYNIE